jgi:hypothetical protein
MCGSDSMKRRGTLCFNLSRYGVDGWRGSDRPLGAATLGHRRGVCHWCTARTGRSSAPSLSGVWRLESSSLKWCRGIRDTHPRFNRGGEWLQGGGRRHLNLPGFDGVARPYLRPSGPKDGFPRFLVLSSRSSPDPIASGGSELVLATSALSSRVWSKADRNSGTMAAYLQGFQRYLEEDSIAELF